MITFSETSKTYSDGQINVSRIPESILETGFVPETKTSRGQPLPAQWLNWLFQKLFRYINRDVVTDANGVGLFTVPNSLIRLEAFDKGDPTKYIVATGWKGLDVAPQFNVLSSNGLTLGTGTEDGNQPVEGGADVVIVGYSRQFGEM